jgi:hypothetical protein
MLAFAGLFATGAEARSSIDDIQPCPSGYYAPNPNKSSCQAADPGYYVPSNQARAKSQIPAPPGSYVPGYAATSPTKASPGYYVSGTAQTGQTAAGPGTYVPGTGAKAPTLAPPGSYVPTTGAAAPTLASKGYYVSGSGKSAQTAAAPGSYVPTTGAVAPTLAAPGFFVAGAAAAAATAAPAGSYVPNAGATAPILAMPGYYAAKTGQTEPTIALPGSYVPNAGATGPKLAYYGQYVPTSGATAPINAPRGSYVNTLGATAPTVVPPGAYAPLVGTVTPNICGWGASYGGASACRQTIDRNPYSGVPGLFSGNVAPEAALSETALSFADTHLADSTTLPLTISNIAAFDTVGAHLTTLSLLSYSISLSYGIGGEPFTLTGFVPGMTLEQGQSAVFGVVFRPLTPGLHTAWLDFVTDEFDGFGLPGKSFRVELSGQGLEQGSPGGVVPVNLPPAAVPEPATWAMLVVGFGLIGGTFRRRATARCWAAA